ncbi:MAG: hypothetical protein LBG72_00545 [Spirochaetaceae bacterium]|nr:hypothetical protein [Spirochaetaceae bacterium]
MKNKDGAHFAARFAARFAAAFCLVFLLPLNLTAQTIEAGGGYDYSFYDKEAAAPSSEAAGFITGRASLEGYMNGFIIYNLDVMRDAVFNYSFNLGIGFAVKRVTLGLGMYGFSPVWNFQDIALGMSGYAGIDMPDAFFARVMYGTTFAAYTDLPGTKSYRVLDAKAGFWVYNMLVSVNFMRKIFVSTESEILRKNFARTKLFARVIIYGKAAPFSLQLDAGVLFADAIYEDNESIMKEDHSTLFMAGLQLNLHFGQHITWYFGGEVPLTIEGGLGGFMFSAETGLKITVLSR